MFPSPGNPSLYFPVPPQALPQASVPTQSPLPSTKASALTWKFLWLVHPLSCVSLFRSRIRGPIGPGKYGYGKAPYILPLQTDSAHSPQRLRRQRPPSRNSRSQGASGSSHSYNPAAHRTPQHGPLYQSDDGPRSGLQASESSIYQLPLTHNQGFPAASSLFHSQETSSSPGMGAHRAAQSFSQPARSTAISCIGAYRQYKLCNTNVSTHCLRRPWK